MNDKPVLSKSLIEDRAPRTATVACKIVAWSFLVIVAAVPLTQLVVDFSRGETPQAFAVLQRPPTEANLRAFEDDLEQRSWFEQRLGRAIRSAHCRLFNEASGKVLAGRGGWLFYRPGVDALIQRKPVRAVSDVAAVIQEFQQQLAQRKIRLLVVPVPGKASIYPERLTRRVTEPATDTLLAKLLRELQRRNIPAVDLFQVFARQRGEQGDKLYLQHDTHWTPRGLQIAAAEVAGTLNKLGWLDSANEDPGGHWTRQPKTVSRVGDLVAMAELPQLKRQNWAQPVTTHPVSRNGKPNKPVDGGSVLLLGDSFSRIYETDAPGSAGFPSQLSFELRRPIATIVNDGGASTLVRQQLSRRQQMLQGKRVVVWEFVERDILFGTEGWQRVDFQAE